MANTALIDELEKQFRDNPRRVFARLANEYRKAGDLERALEICQAHVPQQPGYISGHIVLGQALFDAGQLEPAQQTFETALSLDPENLIALRQLGDIARLRDDLSAARGWYTRLLDVDPQNDDVVAQLGALALAEQERGTAAPATLADSELEEIEADASVAVADEPEDEELPEAERFESEYLDTGLADTLDDEPEASVQDAPDDEPMEEFEAVEFTEIALGEPIVAADPSPAPSAEELVEFSWDEADAEDSGATAGTPDDAAAGPAGADLDFTFISEDEEEPLTLSHTGESLAVVPEEDPLAGVQPVRSGESSPFGSPVAARAEDDRDDRSFEPLPTAELDAASSEGEDDADDADFEAWSLRTGPAEDAAPSGDRDGAALGMSEAETLMDDDADLALFRWPDATAEAVEVTDEIRPEGLLTNDGTATAPAATADGLVPTDEVPLYEDPAVLPDDAADVGAAAGDDAGADDGWAAEDAREDYAFEPVEEDDASLPDDETAVTAEWRAMPEAPAIDEPVDAPAAVADAGADAAVDAEEHPAGAGEPQAGDPDDDVADEEEAPAEAPAFVTETMAELYLRQGFREEALRTYRQLAAQSPDDGRLRARVAELESPTAAPAPAAEPDQPPRRAAAFFRALASVRVPAMAPVQDAEPAPDSFGGWADAVLSDAGEVRGEDESAAQALAAGFAPAAEGAEAIEGQPARNAQRELSLDEIFGSSERQREAGRGTSSLDAFFTPEGERAATDDAPDAPPDGDDLQAFSAWLEGLKK